MLYRLLTTMGLLAAAVPAAAEPVQLSGQDIKTILSGALLHLDTPAGTVIPVRFGTDGLVSGKAGVLASVLGAERDRGRWWVERERLCMKWFRWFEAQTRCVSVRREGERLFWRGEDRDGTGTIIQRPQLVTAAASKSPAAPAAKKLADTAPAPSPAEKPPEKKEEIKEAPVALADATPTPAAWVPSAASAEEAAPDAGTSQDRAAKLALRFAAASLDGMTFAPPVFAQKVAEPHHLLPAAERQAISAEPELTEPARTETETSSAPAPTPPRKAPQVASAYASSTVILASYKVARVDADDMLNVRSGPSEQFPPVGGLPPEGRGVRIVGPCEADWCPIRHKEVTGWVNRNFLAEEVATPATVTVSR